MKEFKQLLLCQTGLGQSPMVNAQSYHYPHMLTDIFFNSTLTYFLIKNGNRETALPHECDSLNLRCTFFDKNRKRLHQGFSQNSTESLFSQRSTEAHGDEENKQRGNQESGTELKRNENRPTVVSMC